MVRNTVSGVPSVLNLMASTTAPPKSTFLSGDSAASPLLPYTCLYELLNIRDVLIPVLNMGFGGDSVQVNVESELR